MTSTGPHRMLAQKFTLHDVDDVEKHCRRVVSDWRRRTEANLNPSDEEDMVAYLLETARELAEFKYDGASGKKFSAYSYSILSLRSTDWLRQKAGRTCCKFAGHTHVRERPTLLSLDAPAGTDPDARNWERLSPIGAATARRIASPISQGCTVAEVSSAIGISQFFVRRLLETLKSELEV